MPQLEEGTLTVPLLEVNGVPPDTREGEQFPKVRSGCCYQKVGNEVGQKKLTDVCFDCYINSLSIPTYFFQLLETFLSKTTINIITQESVLQCGITR